MLTNTSNVCVVLFIFKYDVLGSIDKEPNWKFFPAMLYGINELEEFIFAKPVVTYPDEEIKLGQ